MVQGQQERPLNEAWVLTTINLSDDDNCLAGHISIPYHERNFDHSILGQPLCWPHIGEDPFKISPASNRDPRTTRISSNIHRILGISAPWIMRRMILVVALILVLSRLRDDWQKVEMQKNWIRLKWDMQPTLCIYSYVVLIDSIVW
jgi:hypothetical protein